MLARITAEMSGSFWDTVSDGHVYYVCHLTVVVSNMSTTLADTTPVSGRVQPPDVYDALLSLKAIISMYRDHIKEKTEGFMLTNVRLVISNVDESTLSKVIFVWLSIHVYHVYCTGYMYLCSPRADAFALWCCCNTQNVYISEMLALSVNVANDTGVIYHRCDQSL